MSNSKIYKISDLMDVPRKGHVPPNCDLTLQIKAEYAEDGIARGKWEVDEKFVNGHGIVMGGFLSSAADIMMAYAIASKLDDSQGFASIDLDTTFHRPALPGVVDVEARVERMGKTVAYLVAELTQNGKKIATTVSSVLIRDL
ncbi:MAG: PaaI family thioesterase [Bacillaceae bacterium]|nr:PaaI family thioesterase [Bacillaceae bacterium]